MRGRTHIRLYFNRNNKYAVVLVRHTPSISDVVCVLLDVKTSARLGPTALVGHSHRAKVFCW